MQHRMRSSTQHFAQHCPIRSAVFINNNNIVESLQNLTEKNRPFSVLNAKIDIKIFFQVRIPADDSLPKQQENVVVSQKKK